MTDQTIIHVLVCGLALAFGLAAGWAYGRWAGRRVEREIARMLDRQRRGFDPYESENPPVMRQDRLI